MNLVNLKYEFNRITFKFKKGTRHQGLIKGNPFECNTKIHPVQCK